MADENKTLTAVSDSELNSLVAVELKSGKFRSSYLGQLSTYLSTLDTLVQRNSPIGNRCLHTSSLTANN